MRWSRLTRCRTDPGTLQDTLLHRIVRARVSQVVRVARLGALSRARVGAAGQIVRIPERSATQMRLVCRVVACAASEVETVAIRCSLAASEVCDRDAVVVC